MDDVKYPQTYLFIVRMWLVWIGEGKSEWRGKVQHVPRAEVRYFRDWSSLIKVLQEMIGETKVVEDDKAGGGLR